MTQKTRLARLACLLSVLALLVSVTACKKNEVYRIGVSQCSSDDWRNKMNEEILREMMFHDDAVVEIRSADDDTETQIADLRYFADNDYDIIIAAPIEAEALTPVISEIYTSGTPVLLFDRNIHGDSYTAFIGADNVEVGRSAAEYVKAFATGGANVLEIEGLMESSPAEERHRGFNEAIAGDRRIKVVAKARGNWNAVDAERVADSLLRLHPETNVIFAHNDRMAIAASRVARAAGRDDIRIVGVDAAPEIGVKAVADTVIDATFLYPTDGYRLIRTAMAILKGVPYQRNTKLPSSTVVDLSNAEILLRQNDELKEETNKITVLKSQVDEYWTRHSVQTSLFYATVTIVVLLFIIIFALVRDYWTRRRHQEALARQNRELEAQRDQMIELNRQVEDATQSKLVFFTNVSHDLRTPLTLVATPLEQLSQADNLTPDQHNMVKMANKNVRILMRLINQILDFRKYENGKLDLHLTEVDLTALMSEWCESFRAIAHQRDIKFVVNIDQSEPLTTAIDMEKFERVMFNLISNAFKYTPANGEITIAMNRRGSEIVITVTDTGQGISNEDLPRVFERFFQVDKINPKGSGIGLSLAKTFVEMHSGTLHVDSELGKGACFTIVLPVKHVEGEAVATGSRITPEDITVELGAIDAEPTAVENDKTTILVIDDNSDMRTMVSTLLKDDYVVLTASNGYSGLKMAAKYVPDLIVCDVMMPVMDGMECCRSLKAEQSTSHIPVLLFTACSMDEQRAQGYDCGADGYLSKPFNAQVLLSRCRSLIDNRQRIQSVWPFAKTTERCTASNAAADTVIATPFGDVDKEFYVKFCQIVDKEMSNPDLSVDSIAGMMGLGRTQFYRKIKALTNYSPVELLRNMRLSRARTLLMTTDKSVSEIAYEVGFSTPAYFGKCYRERYGETPTEIRSR